MMDEKKLGVIGFPAKHSKSPIIHHHWIKKHNLNATYNVINIAPNRLKEGIALLIDEGYAGFNCTVPHKELMMNLCDEVDDLARAVGAVNTVKISAEGKLSGTNTDVFGFIENIRQNQPEFSFTSGPVVVLGAGGAARAVVYGLLLQNVPEIVILNRTRERAEAIRDMAPDIIRVEEWDKRSAALDGARLVVNCTTLGMSGQPPMFIDMRMLSQAALVTDLVYDPLMTDFLQKAKVRGNKIVTGIGMLLYQAQPAFQSWFGMMPDVDEALIAQVSG